MRDLDLLVAGANRDRDAERPISEFLLAMVAGLFAYGGWHMVTYTAGETIMPARTIPLALIAGVAIVTACYMAMNVALPGRAARSIRFGRRRASPLTRPTCWSAVGGASVMAALVMMSSLGGLTGIVLTGPRVYYSMARRRTGVPLASLRAPGLPHAVARDRGRRPSGRARLRRRAPTAQLFTRVIYTEWLFFALMALGVFVLRRRPGYRPPYRTWGYPVVPAVFIVASLVIVINQVVRTPVEALTGLGIVALGVPVYTEVLKVRSSGPMRPDPES